MSRFLTLPLLKEPKKVARSIFSAKKHGIHVKLLSVELVHVNYPFLVDLHVDFHDFTLKVLPF